MAQNLPVWVLSCAPSCAGLEAALRQVKRQRTRDLAETVAQRERELAVLSQVAARVHGEDDVQKIFDIALEEILGRLEVPAAWIFTGQGDHPQLTLAASRGVSATYLDAVRRCGLSECLCPEVFATGERTQARNTTHCPRMPEIVAAPVASSAHACIPLRFEDSTRGVLNVAAPPGVLFSEDELRFLETLGHQVGLAVERARHRHAESARNQEARAMAAVIKAVGGGSLDPVAVLKAVGETACDVLGGERVVLFLGADPAHVRVGHLAGLPHPELRERQSLDLVKAGATLHVKALQERRSFSVEDWRTEPGVNAALALRWDAGSAMVVPMMARERVLGLLVVTRRLPTRWTEVQLETAEALASQAGVALESARLYDETRAAFRELKDAQERIIQSEKMAVLGTFASGLAHEVRNPLNSIGLQLAILERRIARLEGPVAGSMVEVAGIIREEVRRLDGLVGDFLLFSRATRVQHEAASLDAVVDEVMRLLQPEAAAAGVVLSRSRAGQPVDQMRMDAEKMKQVVINLVRNALEALTDGGQVTVESGAVDGQARLVVEDDGPGLPTGLDVFQLFVTTKAKGTGLGLSIVQQVVRQHGGEVAAENRAGGGARFVVTLPLPAEDSGKEC
jgi:signal transduction histidine kinase